MILTISVTGSTSDLDFLRERMIGAVEDVAAEYEQNLDGEVTVEWEYDEG